MEPDIPPAIAREYTYEDSLGDDEIISTPYDGVSRNPGLGPSGYYVETVEHECPSCQFDRMVRRVDVTPERPDEVRYWCLYPNCKHYLRNMMSHVFAGSYPNRNTSEPEVFD